MAHMVPEPSNKTVAPLIWKIELSCTWPHMMNQAWKIKTNDAEFLGLLSAVRYHSCSEYKITIETTVYIEWPCCSCANCAFNTEAKCLWVIKQI